MMTDPKEIASLLERVPLFLGLSRKHLERLARRVVEREYPEGRIIVEQNKGGEGFFLLVEGAAEVVRERTDGNKVVVNKLGENDFFGELALLDEGLRTASVVTTEPTRCLVLTRWDFLATLQEDCSMAVPILQEMARRFRLALDTSL